MSTTGPDTATPPDGTGPADPTSPDADRRPGEPGGVSARPGGPDDAGGRISRPLHHRRFELGLVAVAAAIPLLIGVMAALGGWKVTGDNALISIRVGDVLRGDLPTSGLPTTGENFGSGVASNHPGPMQFYVLAPFQAAYGIDVGMALGAAFVNAVAWGLATWAMTRRHGLIAGAATLGIYGLLAFGLGAHLLYDPVSSNIATFASITAVLLAAALLDGDWELAPAFVLVATFVIQAHLTYVALGVPVVLVVLVALGQRLATRRSVPVVPLVGAAVLGVVLWAPVAWDQFFGTGNVGNVVRTFSEGKTVGVGFGFAFGRLWYAIAPIPMFARRIEGLEFLTDATPMTTALGVATLVAFGAGCWWLHRRASALVSLAALVGLVLAASVYSASKLPSAATVKAANLRWMWTGGALLWLVLVLVLAEAASRRWRRVDVFSAVACLAVFAVAAGVGSFWLVSPRDEATFDAVAHLRVDTSTKLDDPVYLVKYDGNEALLTVGPAVVADLIAEGIDARVSLGPFERAYGDHVADEAIARRASVLLVAAAEVGSPEDLRAAATPSGQVLAERRYSPGEGKPEVVVRVILVDVPAACEELNALAAELTDPGGRPQAEVLGRLAAIAQARLAVLGRHLSDDEVSDVRILIGQLKAWEAALEADPTKDLTTVVVGDFAVVEDGLVTLNALCGQT